MYVQVWPYRVFLNVKIQNVKIFLNFRLPIPQDKTMGLSFCFNLSTRINVVNKISCGASYRRFYILQTYYVRRNRGLRIYEKNGNSFSRQQKISALLQ